MKLAIFPLLFVSSLHAQNSKVKNFWFNGAEINSYKLEQARYGETHHGHAELIFVTEPFLLGKQVKNETQKSNSTSVLKLNSLRTFNTGLYSYRTMTSTFRPIDLASFPHALKSVTTVQDWCGQSFQQFNYRENRWQVQLRSYFENEGDQNLKLPTAHMEDELWLTLRLDPKKLPTGEISIIPGAVFTRFHHKVINQQKAQASLKQSGESSVYTLIYSDLNRTLSIHFGTKFPHIIQKWTEQTASGTTTATLNKRLMNNTYWNENKPQDAEKRKTLGIDPIAN